MKKITLLIVVAMMIAMPATMAFAQGTIRDTVESQCQQIGTPMVTDPNGIVYSCATYEDMALVQAPRWIVGDAAIEVDGLQWYVPAGTHYAVSTASGRYEAVEPTTNFGVVNGVDYSWCEDATLQPDCPPHGFRIRTMEERGAQMTTDTMMDISWRILVENQGHESVSSALSLQYNDTLRNRGELMDDYASLASNGGLGLFIATKDPSMEAMLYYGDQQIVIGYSVWDGIPDTAGPTMTDQPLPLNDPEMTRFGEPQTQPLGSAINPGVVIPIPAPDQQPDFELSVLVLVPEGVEVVYWLGRYDVPAQ